MEQYNALLAAAPLLESVLVGEKKEDVVRPDYDAQPAVAPQEEGDDGDEGGEVEQEEVDEEEEE